MILDSTFLVDFERECARRKAGPAMGFLETRTDEELCITFTIAGELRFRRKKLFRPEGQ